MGTFKIHMDLDKAVYKATADIEQYDKNVQQAIKAAVADGVTAIKEQAMRMAPAGPTGNLKAGIKSEMGQSGAYGVIKSTAPHSRLVEFGTGERITYNKAGKKAMVINGRFVRGDIYNGKMPAKPFMRPAAEAEKPKIEESIKKVLQ
jgi:HK97 gp10 family phage protein